MKNDKLEHWEIDKINKASDGTVISIQVTDKEYRDTRISFKWDGCLDYNQYLNGYTVDDEPSEEKSRNREYIHICDIDVMINKLQEIKKIAQMKFSSENYNEYWNK
jgi:hypothetical protein